MATRQPQPPQIVDEFWEICNAAHESWLARRGLFEDNAELEQLGRTHCAEFLRHLDVVTQQDVLHQIAKLHDPARQFGQSNLSIGADVEYFKSLQELVDIVAGTPRPFNDLVRNDARMFVEALMRGSRPNR